MTRRGDPMGAPHRQGLSPEQFDQLRLSDRQRLQRDPHDILPGKAFGGRIPWFATGADFIAKRPHIIGVGDTPHGERVTVTPQAAGGAGNNTRPVNIKIDNIVVNRKGDVKKIVDEELRMLADSLGKNL